MHSSKKTAKKLPATLLIFLISGCNIDKDTIFVGDHENSRIINRKGDFIACEEPEFNTMTCVPPKTLSKIKSCMEKCD